MNGIKTYNSEDIVGEKHNKYFSCYAIQKRVLISNKFAKNKRDKLKLVCIVTTKLGSSKKHMNLNEQLRPYILFYIMRRGILTAFKVPVNNRI